MLVNQREKNPCRKGRALPHQATRNCVWSLLLLNKPNLNRCPCICNFVHKFAVSQDSPGKAYLCSTWCQLGGRDWGLSHMAGKWVLTVSWELREGWGPGALVSLHGSLSTSCSGSSEHGDWLERVSITREPGEGAVCWEMFNNSLPRWKCPDLCSIVFADFHGANTPTTVNFKPLNTELVRNVHSWLSGAGMNQLHHPQVETALAF